jgi:hypothetical protein
MIVAQLEVMVLSRWQEMFNLICGTWIADCGSTDALGLWRSAQPLALCLGRPCLRRHTLGTLAGQTRGVDNVRLIRRQLSRNKR